MRPGDEAIADMAVSKWLSSHQGFEVTITADNAQFNPWPVQC